ncbi:MAG: hypothetical protein JWO67_3713 [Streptosporangiaceae bacterium]|nr:hypothetical protein [Streptosporangiaceae bacterium]
MERRLPGPGRLSRDGGALRAAVHRPGGPYCGPQAQRGETGKAKRCGWAEESRVALRRHGTTAAAEACGESRFFARLEAEGVLVRRRLSQQDPAEAAGYAVALPADRNPSGEPIWYSGGKLATDLTLPKLRRRWMPPVPAGRQVDPLSEDYRAVSGRHLSGRCAEGFLRTIVREAADRSAAAEEFFRHLDQAGILVRRRLSEINPGEVTGYDVALPDHLGRDDRPVWFAGSRFADDLSFRCLQERWSCGSGPRIAGQPPRDLSEGEVQAFYDDAARATTYATAQIRRYAVINPYAARNAAWAASDVLHVAARATGNKHLRRAADAYDRAARAPYGQIPKPTPAGGALRTAAWLMAIAGLVGDHNTVTVLAVVTSLIALMEAVAHLHDAQQRAAQAAASRVRPGRTSSPPRARTRPGWGRR